MRAGGLGEATRIGSGVVGGPGAAALRGGIPAGLVEGGAAQVSGFDRPGTSSPWGESAWFAFTSSRIRYRIYPSGELGHGTFFEISRSSRICRLSRRRRRNSRRSAVVRPSSLRPSSSFAYRTQFRIVCGEHSNSRDNFSAVRPAQTSPTICCRYSGAYRLDFVMVTPPDHSLSVSTKAGQLQGDGWTGGVGWPYSACPSGRFVE